MLQPQSHPQGASTPDWPAQPATKPQAPLRHPSHSSQIAQWKGKKKPGDREGTPRTAKLLKFNPQRHANRAMNTLQAHWTTTHELTKNTAGQCQPQGSHNHMTVTCDQASLLFFRDGKERLIQLLDYSSAAP